MSNDAKDTATVTEEQRLAGLEAGRECLEAALRYEQLGLSVTSCCPPDHYGVGKWHLCDNPGKRPWHKWKRLEKERAAERQIRDWWHEHPNANVGAALGPVSGLVGIDVDGDEGELELLEASGGHLPPTWEFTSGKGRRLLYAIPRDAVLRSTHFDKNAKRPLSLLAEGSQTVMPPSRHVCGRRYEWGPGCSPDDIDPAPAPRWLLDALKPEVGANGTAGEYRGRAEPVVGDITDGRRDKTLVSMGGTMRHRGFCEESILAALGVTNRKRCKPPLPDEIVQQKARSVCRYPAGNVPLIVMSSGTHGCVGPVNSHVDVVVPKEAGPFVEFPVHAMPPPLSCFVAEAAAALNCDPCYFALPVLAAVAGAIGNSRSIQLKPDWYEPAIVWSGLIGESGTLKTPAFKLALQPVYKVQRRRRRSATTSGEPTRSWSRDCTR